jgi:hypothetical protein
MSSVRIDIDEGGMAEVAHTFTRVRNNFLDDCLPDAVRNAPVDTGELKASGYVDHGAGVVGFRADHAAAVELGARAHEIPNAWGRGITVHHPGTKAQTYLRPAVYRARRLRA